MRLIRSFQPSSDDSAQCLILMLCGVNPAVAYDFHAAMIPSFARPQARSAHLASTLSLTGPIKPDSMAGQAEASKGW